MRRPLLALSLLVLAACTETAGPAASRGAAFQEQISAEYFVGVTTWTGASGGETRIYHSLRNVDGMAALCGAYDYAGGPSVGQLSGELVRAFRADFGGARMLDSIAYFRRAPGGRGVANCRVTEMPWQPAMETLPVEFDTPRASFRI